MKSKSSKKSTRKFSLENPRWKTSLFTRFNEALCCPSAGTIAKEARSHYYGGCDRFLTS